MTEHHSQEALNSQDYPHCRQAALCSIAAIFSKWCNSCKGSPRTFNLRAQAILKRVSRHPISLHCHLPILGTSLLPTQVTLFKFHLPRKRQILHMKTKSVSIHLSANTPALQCIWQESYTTLYRDFLTSWFSVEIRSSLASLLNFCEDFEKPTKLIHLILPQAVSILGDFFRSSCV